MRLRKALEPDLEKGQPSRYVLRSEGRYLFNRQARVLVDTWALEALTRPRGGEAAADENARLRRALAICTGDFLPEFKQDWVLALRQRFRDRALAACSRLLALAGDRDPRETLEVAHRALDIDPLAEEFHRERILRYLVSGLHA